MEFLSRVYDRLDVEVRMERERIAQAERAKLSRGRFARPKSPAWTVDADTVTVSTPSGRTVSAEQVPRFVVYTLLEKPCSILSYSSPSCVYS